VEKPGDEQTGKRNIRKGRGGVLTDIRRLRPSRKTSLEGKKRQCRKKTPNQGGTEGFKVKKERGKGLGGDDHPFISVLQVGQKKKGREHRVDEGNLLWEGVTCFLTSTNRETR